MKKFILPMLVAFLVFAIPSGRFFVHASKARTTLDDVGEFANAGHVFEAYATTGTRHIVQLIDENSNVISASGSYTAASGGTGTINVAYTINGVTTTYSGPYLQ